MAGEGTGFLAQTTSNDDLDLELLDDRLEFTRQGHDGRGRFGLILRLATMTTLACTVGWILSALSSTRRPHRVAPSIQAVGLEAWAEHEAQRKSLLKPVESMHDGNVCDTNEELYGGLCYKRCDLLTHGEAPIRTSSWTCCKNHPCHFGNQQGSIGHSLLCNGFDVNGEGGCPHKPGACLVDEEMVLGLCYKKCSLLTQGEFPFRVAAATCCKTQGLGCLNLLNDKTSNAFNVGGGSGDNDPSTPSDVHPPDEEWTESGAPPTTTMPVSLPSQFVQDAHFEPVEDLHDGNICDDEEELYGGLCYKKCSLLTDAEAPIRTSSWTCCKSHPCGLMNQKGSVGHTLICNGYDVSADGACPHKPGACLMNEELVGGVCYEKCGLLTNGAFPYRLTAATCCKVSGLGCLNPMNDMTSDAFDTGGGASADKDHQAHLPDEALTEADSPTLERESSALGRSVPPSQQVAGSALNAKPHPALVHNAGSSAIQAIPQQPSQQNAGSNALKANPQPSWQGSAGRSTEPIRQLQLPAGESARSAPQELHANGAAVRATEQELPLGSAIRLDGAPVRRPTTAVSSVSKEAQQAHDALEAQAALNDVMRAMK